LCKKHYRSVVAGGVSAGLQGPNVLSYGILVPTEQAFPPVSELTCPFQ
jgi:hypothetical protein